MIRGFRKNMYFIRDTGSPVFSEAYFVLRGDGLPVVENDLAAEADRILRERFPGGKRRWHRPKHLTAIMFVLGVIVGAAVMGIL